MSHGGDRIAEVLQRQGVKSLFTLCGGHISPILVGAKALGIRVAERVPIIVPPNRYNKRYLETKRLRMAHKI